MAEIEEHRRKITSFGQSGGITAGKVNLENQNNFAQITQPKRRFRVIAIISGIVIFLAGVATILNFLGIKIGE